MKKTWLACCFAGLGLTAYADPELSRIQDQIEQVRRDLDAERRMYEAERSRQGAWEEASSAQLEDTRRQARRARTEADSLAAVLRGMGAPAQSRGEEMQRAHREMQAFAEAAAEWADSVLSKVMREELPGYAEVKERALKDLARGLRTGVIPADQGLGRLLDQVTEIIEQGRRTEVRPGTYTTLSGRPVEGHFLTSGGFYEGFVSVDGDFAAYRRRTVDGWVWRESVPAERRQNLLRIANMLQGGQEPGFVPLPFGLVSGDEE